MSITAQDLENIGSTTLDKLRNSPLKINGGVSATGIYYDSNGRSARDPFTYFLQGNLNISWLTFNMPVSYSFTNQGDELDFGTPYKFNRLSIHPEYKWVKTHIGDVAMTFSPYTLNGHQFTGAGVELTPEGGFSISAMGGRLLEATEDDGDPRTLPAFSRMGYGSKLGWEQENYRVGLIGFYAKDNINSIEIVPDARGITPQENLVIGLDGEVRLGKNYKINAEYAATAITSDLRAGEVEPENLGLLSSLFNNRGSTEYYSAYNIGLEMETGKTKLGIRYEHIDPGYETLGAYFFNNDFENITLIGSRPLFNNKLNLSFNVGYQRDNLDQQKTQGTSRFVAATNATLQVTDKVTLTGSYSNFSSFTNSSLNQFDDINDSDLTDEDLEALDFKQLSQNANVNLNWILAQGEKNTQSVNFNYSLASSANEQGGVIRVGQANNFHNGNAVYTIGFPKNNLTLATSFNYNYSDIGRDDSDAYGGAVDVGKKFLGGKLNSSLGAVYNTNRSPDSKTDVLNFRGNASLVVAEKHIFNLNAVQVFNSSTNTDNDLSEITVTFGYVYTFDIGAPKFKKKDKEPKAEKTPRAPMESKEKIFSFSYRSHRFKGQHDTITNEITELLNTPQFETLKQINTVVKTLSELEESLEKSQNTTDKKYKKAGIEYLKYLYENKDYLETYHKLMYSVLKQLYRDLDRFDNLLEKDYLLKLGEINTAESKGEKVSPEDLKILEYRKRQYEAPVWIMDRIFTLSFESISNDVGLLKEFRLKYFSEVYDMLQNENSQQEIEIYLETQLIDFYHQKFDEQ